LNQLSHQQLQLETGEISQALQRGKHTTRKVSLYSILMVSLIADTPGFSSYEAFEMDVTNDYLRYFPELLSN
jgi:ribosome biogenesis GTPase